MEKKRRSRINDSLEALKQILLKIDPENVRKTGSRTAKLEKADILEMTVRYLRSLTPRVGENGSCRLCPSNSHAQQNAGQYVIDNKVNVGHSSAASPLNPGGGHIFYRPSNVPRYCHLLKNDVWRPWNNN
ncbi:hypothetical protein NQ318_003387 [Aromia moschata]|uniref:BHLH domain-containing protein n=1 Tax=Aromia moschata TaxID=1265417 RepID=A0AAV8XNC5_9CUCU|nr:hypothetical protein NQ318_003387 [Aromia moschata]